MSGSGASECAGGYWYLRPPSWWGCLHMWCFPFGRRHRRPPFNAGSPAELIKTKPDRCHLMRRTACRKPLSNAQGAPPVAAPGHLRGAAGDLSAAAKFRRRHNASLWRVVRSAGAGGPRRFSGDAFNLRSGEPPPLIKIALAADMLVVEQSCKGFSVNYQALDHAASSALDPFHEPTRTVVRQRMRRRELMIEKQGAAAVCDDLYRIYGPAGRQRGLMSRAHTEGSPPR